jgi:nondiscriminating aspartyl-tRNA synthetase
MFLGQGNRLPEITQYPQIKFSEAKRLYADAHNKPAEDLADLSPDEEKWLGEHFLKEHNAPIVFITHYPSKKRPFYAMDDPTDTRVTLSFDCLMYGQEVTTGGQRIHDYHEQVAKMQARGMDIADFGDYLAMHKYGMPPHGGLALGMERVVQKLLGLDNIRRATAFPRDRERLSP